MERVYLLFGGGKFRMAIPGEDESRLRKVVRQQVAFGINDLKVACLDFDVPNLMDVSQIIGAPCTECGQYSDRKSKQADLPGKWHKMNCSKFKR